MTLAETQWPVFAKLHQKDLSKFEILFNCSFGWWLIFWEEILFIHFIPYLLFSNMILCWIPSWLFLLVWCSQKGGSSTFYKNLRLACAGNSSVLQVNEHDGINVCSIEKYTKRSNNTLLRLVYLFSERTLYQNDHYN